MPRPFDVVDRVLGAPERYNASEPQTHPGPTQTRLGAWWCDHPRAIKAVAVGALLWTAVYLTWRVGWSGEGTVWWLWLPLLVAEMFGFWSLFTLTFFGWERPACIRPPVSADHSVDVLVCTYDESVDLLRTTLAGCAALDYPHTTYLLDDGRRPEMQQLAEEMGAIWLTRPDNSHAKAGNINHALGCTGSELLFILDADHVPMPDALSAVVGYMDDPNLALVQTPHDFYNQDSAQHYAVGRHEQSIFYDVICPGKDRHGAAFWCGSATLIRREALVEVGGVAVETIAEDFHTTIKMHRKGWTTKYHNEVLVQGLGPHDLDGYLLQRDRWARGNLAVFTTPESPLRASELTAKQRLSFFASLTSYAAGPVRVLSLLILVGTLWTGALPLRASLLPLAVFWFPSVVLSLLAASALSRGFMKIADSTHFELCTAEVYGRALRCAVRPAKTAFKVTPKSGTDDAGLANLRRLKVVMAVAGALTLGVILRIIGLFGPDVLPSLPGIASSIVPVLAVIELRRVARTLRLVARRRQRRSEFRFPCHEPAEIITIESGALRVAPLSTAGRLLDISTRGARVVVAAAIEPGTEVTLTTRLCDAMGAPFDAELRARVVLCRPEGDEFQLGTVFDDISPTVMRRLVEFCYIVCPYERLRGTRPLDQTEQLGQTEQLEPTDARRSG
ncbi:MAG: glycosyltransferase [Acidimicrobiales bacterium]